MDGGQEASQITLQNIILRADSHGIDGNIFANGAGNENEGHVGIFFTHDFERGNAAEPGHGKIGDDAIPLPFAQQLVEHLGCIHARV